MYTPTSWDITSGMRISRVTNYFCNSFLNFAEWLSIVLVWGNRGLFDTVSHGSPDLAVSGRSQRPLVLRLAHVRYRNGLARWFGYLKKLVSKKALLFSVPGFEGIPDQNRVTSLESTIWLFSMVLAGNKGCNGPGKSSGAYVVLIHAPYAAVGA